MDGPGEGGWTDQGEKEEGLRRGGTDKGWDGHGVGRTRGGKGGSKLEEKGGRTKKFALIRGKESRGEDGW